MIRTFKTIGFCALITAAHYGYGQSASVNKEIAREKAKEAIRIEDEEQRYDEAIILLSEAQRLDPDNIDYPYELAYTYSIKKEYNKASEILERLLSHKDVYGLIYQALGNAYDYQGKPEKAIETYEKGLKKFPNTGELYLELGNMQLAKKEYNKALDYYETGIEKDPAYPSNYYRTALLFLGSDEEVWGMIYGELFMNLERGSKRTEEISKGLFDTYKSEIKLMGDSSSVSFSKYATINVNPNNPKDIKLPFGIGVYEPNLLLGTVGEKSIDIGSLNRIRTRFLDAYSRTGNDKKYPNALFEYQQKIKKAGHFEAYNYWILMQGDDEGFNAWKKNNDKKWGDFITWFKENPIKVDVEHKFIRWQY